MEQPRSQPLSAPQLKIQQCPFACRLIYGCILTCLFIDFFTSNWLYRHLNCNFQSIWHGWQIWRFPLSWMTERYGSVTFFICLNISNMFIKFEKRNGSAVLVNDFWVISLGLNLACLLIHFTFYILLGKQFEGNGTGIAIVWINMLYKYCYYNSEVKIKIPGVDKIIPLYYYPFASLLVVCILSWSFRWDAIFGLFLATFECKYFNGGFILFAKDSYDDKEKFFSLIKVTQMKSWQKSGPIEENHRMTVNSSQFYLKLQEYQTKQNIQDESQSLNTKSSETISKQPKSHYFSGKGISLSDDI